MSSKKPLAKPVSTQKTDLAALRKASKLPLANPDKQEEEKLLSDVAAEEAQDTPVQLAAAPSTVVSDASPAGAHSVGDAHAAHAAQPASQASGMGALSSNWLLGAAGFGLVAAAASGGGGGGSSPAATPTPSQQGTAIDGYVVGADVYLDTNNNHQLDAGDTKVGTTGKGGTFSVSNPNKLDVFVKGGFNDSNQNGTKDAGELDNTVVLKATGGTSGNFIVSPLTTLVQELLRQSPQTTQKAAESTIKAALGLDQAIDLTTFDPLAAGNTANALAAYKAAVQVATALDIAADEQAFLQALVSKLTANTTPGASGILVSSITAAFTGSTDNNVTSTELLNKLELIGSATSIGNITESQAQVNNDKEVAKPVFTLNRDTGSSQTDNITRDKVVKVTLAADVASWEYSLKGGEWTKGTGTSFNLADNATYAAGEIKVRQTDKAGNVSEVANNAVAITVDNAVSQPTFALNDDTGIPDDLITNDNVVNVTLAQDVASWQYSLKGGDWVQGTGTSFNLADNTSYAVGDIRVRQTDKAGNVSEAASNTALIQEDSAVAKPAFALNSDSGIADDLITNDNVVNVTLAQDVASWQYSLKGGDWVQGTGTSFNLEDNTSYAVGDIRVRQTDKAGNVSEAASNTLRIIEDSLVEAPTVALSNDTGAPPNDKVTSSATLTVTTTEPDVVVEYTLDGGKNWLSESEYTAAVNHDGEYTVGVRQTDMAGNQSDTSSLAFTLDTTAPTVTNLAINSSSLTFTLGGANGLSPEASQFAVQVNGQDVAITGVSRNGDLVTLTLANPVKANDSVSISSTAQALADAAGNSWTLSQGEVSNTTVPASTLNGVMFFEREELGANDAFNVLHFSGTHLTELLAPNQEVPPSGIDIKNQLDFSKLSWRVQDSIGTVKHVTLSAADILSAKVMNDTSLDITLTPAAMALLGDAGSLLGADDDIFVGAGFLHAANGTAATMADLQILDINTTYSHTVDANSTPDAIAATNIVINGDGAFNPNLIGQDQILTIEGNGSITMSPLVLNGILINASQEEGGRTTVDVSDNAHHIINNQGQGSLTIGLLGNVDLEVSGTAQLDNVDGSGTLTLTGGNQVLALHSATPSGILQVTNFVAGEDLIALSKTAFGLSEDASNGPVALTSLQVVNGTAANTADASLIYNQDTGELFYDNDGTGSNAAVQLLQLDSGLTLSQANFNVVIV